MKSLLAIGIAIFACLDSAAAIPALRPGSALKTSVTLDQRTFAGESPHSLQYMSGLIACEMPPPGTEKGMICPTFGVTFSARERLVVAPDLGEQLHQMMDPEKVALPTSLMLDSDWKLHYTTAGLEFELDIGRYFLPNTVIRKQWSVETGTSDAVFLVSETCDDLQGCRDGLWFIAIDRRNYSLKSLPVFNPSAVTLLAKVDWRQLETGKGFAPRTVGDRLVVFLPLEGGPVPVVAWVASFVEHPDNGILELRYEVYPANWPIPKQE